MEDLPTGTVTFLYTDIEGSTRLLQQLTDRYASVLHEYRRLLLTVIRERNGYEVNTQGDCSLVVFRNASDAVDAAVAAQRAIKNYPFQGGATLKVRMGLHTGEPLIVGGEYVGIDVHRAARVGEAAYGGQILLSETTRTLVEHRLLKGVSLRTLGEYHLKDLTGLQQLFQVVTVDLANDFPPLKSPDRTRNNLPIQLTSFIGREREIAEIKRLLRTTRLLTLTGSGGAGKTRLALQVAAEVLREFEDGVWLVELATCSDPDLVPQAVASTLEVIEQPGVPILNTLSASLRNKQLLLVLDNCEHLVAAAARVAETVLRTCPDLRVLVTSRERLGIGGETSWPVPSLALPDFRRLPIVPQLMKYEAIRLFVERAIAVLPSFTPTDRNAREIARVCHQLDGIPLALELAAARVKGLSMEQMATKLDDRFRLLTKGSRTALPHQQTLRAAMDWSFNLLSEPERIVLRRLSVFAGGFSLEAAEALCAGRSVDASEVLDLLTALVDKSLVIPEERRDETRYRLLETVRQYAGEKLLEAGETTDVARRHRDWYLALAERAEPEFFGREQSSWYERLEVEHANFREALEWSLKHVDKDAGLRLAGALHWFWHVRGYLSEARSWLDRVLLDSEDASTLARAKALFGTGMLAYFQDDYTRAEAMAEASLTLFRALQDKPRVANSFYLLGLVSMGNGEYAQATARLQQSLALFREVESKRGIGISLNLLGDVARCQGDYLAAQSFYDQDLRLRRDLGDDRGIGISLHNLGRVAQHQGDYDGAMRLFKESLEIRMNLGYRMGIAYCLAGVASVAAAKNRPDRAAKLLGAADELLGGIGARLERADRLEYDRTVATVRAVLGDAELEAALTEGRTMTQDQAIDYARST